MEEESILRCIRETDLNIIKRKSYWEPQDVRVNTVCWVEGDLTAFTFTQTMDDDDIHVNDYHIEQEEPKERLRVSTIRWVDVEPSAVTRGRDDYVHDKNYPELPQTN